MRTRWNGSIRSSNTPTYDQEGIARNDYMLYRCMVTKVLYVDDPANISKNATNPEVLYEVIILGGTEAGQTLSNCRLASWLGGNSNYSERILTASSKDPSKVKLVDHDGDIVYIEFIQGHDAYPIILGLAKGLKDTSGAKKSDGPRFIDVYNGVTTKINNKGEWSRSMKSGKVSNGAFKAESSDLIKEEWTSTEQQVTTFKSGLQITNDGKNDKVNITTAGGSSVIVDGKGKKATVTTGSSKIEIDGNSSKITIKAGSAEIIVDGNSGKIQLNSNFVDLGTSVSDFVTQFTQLASSFATHMHVGNLGAPTSPPMAPLLTTVGSQTVKVSP